ncbi:hypothetical protein ABFS83_14G017300 [Erythranthe nasuta]
MEGSVRSGGGVLKKKSSSGCLIIKKKVGINNPGRLVESSSSDEDESLEFMRRRVKDKRLSSSNGSIGVSGERKRSRFDLFEFDEYDEFDGKKMRSEYSEDRYKRVDCNGSGKAKDLCVGSSDRDFGVDKRKHKHKQKDKQKLDGSSSGRSKGLVEEDESIRLQGKNGVLKVKVNKKNYDVVKKDLLAPSPVFAKTPRNRGLFVDKEKSVDKETKETKLETVKPLLSKGKKARDSEVETDTELKLTQPSRQASSRKGMKKEEVGSFARENSTPCEGKEGKVKRGGTTEKQMLREKIRTMLVDAGWTIDYRPRRNRDYQDSVYINPSGTAYWSITKAYDAFKKQLGEDNGESKVDVASPSFAPISENLINKLTRQTKKKLEEEMKRKRKHGTIKVGKRSVKREAAESSDSDQNHNKSSESDDSPKKKSKKIGVENTSTVSKSNILQERTSKVIGRCTLLVRGSDKGENSDSDGYVPYSGKRTVLGWLIDCGTAQLSEKVQYMNRRRIRAMLEGWVTRDGIHCGCCSKILSVSKFELHAGSKLRQPFQNIYLESGSNLLQCQIDAWNSQDEDLRKDFHSVDIDSDDPDDDTCGVCGDGGDLICCDSCPSTFHQICLEIKMLPSGDWNCPNCTCKFCGYANESVAEENDTAGSELNRCSFCEKKYHKSCSEKVHDVPTSSNGSSFCGLKCQELHDHMQKILGVKHELEAGFSWSLIQRTDVSDASHRGFPQRVESNSKLAVALSVMDECFLPIMDRKSGINIIHNVVYNCGSNFNRLNYRGFYTAILERGDEIISAASIRLHGTRLAEMPFIATREIYRRQGMCRRLLSAIETELRSLKVKQLIIPTISEHMNTWTTVFDFHKIEDLHKKEMKSMNMLVFPGTDMLHKELVKQENSDGVKVSDMKPSLEQKQNSDEDDVLDSGPSNAICESDNNTAAANSAEVENEQKEESYGNLKSSPSPDECNNNISDEDNADSSDETVNAESSKSVNVEVDVGPTVNVSEDVGPAVNVSEDVGPTEAVNDSSIESCQTTTVVDEEEPLEQLMQDPNSDEPSGEENKTNRAVDGKVVFEGVCPIEAVNDSLIESSQTTTVVDEEPLEQLKQVPNSNKPSGDKDKETDRAVDGKVVSEDVGPTEAENDSSIKSSQATTVVDEEEPLEKLKHDPNSDKPSGEKQNGTDRAVDGKVVSEDVGPTEAVNDSLIKSCQTITVVDEVPLEQLKHDPNSDEPSGEKENETDHAVDGKVASPVSSSEALIENTTATTET